MILLFALFLALGLGIMGQTFHDISLTCLAAGVVIIGVILQGFLASSAYKDPTGGKFNG